MALAIMVLAAMGCAGGNIFGANPGDGGCGFRPDGLVAGDVVGTWRAENGVTVVLRANGTFEITGAGTFRGRWTLLPKTERRDLDLAVENPASSARAQQWEFFVTGTRAEPWLYTLGDGDPDSCHLIRYDRARP